jgi:hypothetical protein
LEVITPKAACPELVNRMATGPAGKGRPASNAGQRRGGDDNVDHPLQAETLLDAELISRYRVPPAGNPADRSRAVHCSISATGALAAGTLAPPLPIERVNQTQLLPVLVDVNDIETSDPLRRPAARRHLRGPGPTALAAVVLSGVALVILGGLTLRTLLVIAAVGAIVAAARRYRPKK